MVGAGIFLLFLLNKVLLCYPGVLNSERAVQVNIAIMRAFVKLRELMATHKDLARKLEEMEKKYDTQFKVVFDAIRGLMTPPETKKRENRV